MEIRFVKPMKATARIIIDTEPMAENQTILSWSNAGTLPVPINLFIPKMKKHVAKDMDKSLAILKTMLENWGTKPTYNWDYPPSYKNRPRKLTLQPPWWVSALNGVMLNVIVRFWRTKNGILWLLSSMYINRDCRISKRQVSHICPGCLSFVTWLYLQAVWNIQNKLLDYQLNKIIMARDLL